MGCSSSRLDQVLGCALLQRGKRPRSGAPTLSFAPPPRRNKLEGALVDVVNGAPYIE